MRGHWPLWAYEEKGGKKAPRAAKRADIQSSRRSLAGTLMVRRLSDVFVVVLWFAANIGVVFLNKLLLTYYDFRYPVFLTGCHVRQH